MTKRALFALGASAMLVMPLLIKAQITLSIPGSSRAPGDECRSRTDGHSGDLQEDGHLYGQGKTGYVHGLKGNRFIAEIERLVPPWAQKSNLQYYEGRDQRTTI
jgi:hypothetical protein